MKNFKDVSLLSHISPNKNLHYRAILKIVHWVRKIRSQLNNKIINALLLLVVVSLSDPRKKLTEKYDSPEFFQKSFIGNWVIRSKIFQNVVITISHFQLHPMLVLMFFLWLMLLYLDSHLIFWIIFIQWLKILFFRNSFNY